ETSLGNLFADALAETGDCDIMLVGSGSIRGEKLGPVVTLKDYRSIFPYDDYMSRYQINGSQLKRIFSHIMRPENRNGEGECYQVNSTVRAIYSDIARALVSLEVHGQPVEDCKNYSIGLIGYHIANCDRYLNISLEELSNSGKSRVISTSVPEVVEEYLHNHQNASSKVEGRLVYI
ncbi:MAG: bifunctional metallophosphatase/5'-nucleotidase, partial [Dehalococcoidales bacterium]|nr:bifunctional metallophosphatase/5'-nucleotidase [Dehalococcoidales bacterium]